MYSKSAFNDDDDDENIGALIEPFYRSNIYEIMNLEL